MMTKEEYAKGVERIEQMEPDSPDFENLIGDLLLYRASKLDKDFIKQVPIIE